VAAAEIPILVGDTSLEASRDASGVTVSARSVDGAPRSDVLVHLVDCSGRIATTAQPDPAGSAVLSAPGAHLAPAVIARREGRLVGALYLPPCSATGSPGCRYLVSAETGLPVHRPGQTVDFHIYVHENRAEGPASVAGIPIVLGFQPDRPEAAMITDEYGVASGSVQLPPATGHQGPLRVTVDGEEHLVDIGGRAPASAPTLGSADPLSGFGGADTIALSRAGYAPGEQISVAVRGEPGTTIELATLCVGSVPADGAGATAAVWQRCGQSILVPMDDPVELVHMKVEPIRPFERRTSASPRRMIALAGPGGTLVPGATYAVTGPADDRSVEPSLLVETTQKGPAGDTVKVTLTLHDPTGAPVAGNVYVLVAPAEARGTPARASQLPELLADQLRGDRRQPGAPVAPSRDSERVEFDVQGTSRAIVAGVGPTGVVDLAIPMVARGAPSWIRFTAVSADGRYGTSELTAR
jgi:hypothetical protein